MTNERPIKKSGAGNNGRPRGGIAPGLKHTWGGAKIENKERYRLGHRCERVPVYYVHRNGNLPPYQNIALGESEENEPLRKPADDAENRPRRSL